MWPSGDPHRLVKKRATACSSSLEKNMDSGEIHKKEMIGKGRREFEMGQWMGISGRNKSICQSRAGQWMEKNKRWAWQVCSGCHVWSRLSFLLILKDAARKRWIGWQEGREEGPCLYDSLTLLEPHLWAPQSTYNHSSLRLSHLIVSHPALFSNWVRCAWARFPSAGNCTLLPSFSTAELSTGLRA